MAHTARVARVQLDSPLPQLDHPFDYAIPDALAEAAAAGQRVLVPFRSAGRTASGYLLEIVDDGDFDGKLAEIDSIVSPVAVATPQLLSLARRIADRQAGGLSDVLRLAIPKRQVRVEKKWIAEQEQREAAITPALPHVPTVSLGYNESTLALVLDGARCALEVMPRVRELRDGSWVGEWAVTFAGLAARTLASGQSAILVVPDYRDQDQLDAALHDAGLGDWVSRLDARQPNAERYRSFLGCLENTPRVIIGNRSAVYAPAHKLGLIAVWDDGDPLHAEPLAPYPHSRDIALVRQELDSCSLIFAAHSRSVEVSRLVELGWLHELRPERQSKPHVIPTANQAANDQNSAWARIPTAAWKQARAGLDTGPVLVQVAHPGYVPLLSCSGCREPARCTRCHGPLALRSAGSQPSCRLCGAIAADWSCASCQATTLRLVSHGADRTAEELGRAFPGVPIVIADGDHPIQTVPSTPALIIATRGAEPIAAGGYRAVLLLDGERMLARESLRVAEDCLRWWSNAAILAAPGAPVVLVGVGGVIATALSTWRQADWAARELSDRRTLRFPPAVRTASLIGPAEVVTAALDDLPDEIRREVLGPVSLDDGTVRAIVRVDYASAGPTAAALRAAAISQALKRRKGAPGKTFRPAPTLKVRFDDPEIL